MDEKQIIEQKIRDLKSTLYSSASDIGDWKIAKCMEYSMCGETAPYDIAELNKKRQAVRDEINELEEQLSTMEETE